MKKIMILMLIVFSLVGCTNVATTEEPEREYTAEELLLLSEMEASFWFFYEQANQDVDSPGYGLINDRFPTNPNLSSIASVGFGLAGIIVGVEYDWITHEEGFERVDKTLDTFTEMDHFHGFFYHFVDKQTAQRAGNSEVSIIDTALFLAGAIAAGEYFGGSIKEKAHALYERIDWTWYLDKQRNMFYMGYNPGTGFAGHWDFYGEQLILYVLGAGAPKSEHRTSKVVYDSFIRRRTSYGGGETFISSWFGSLFTYQFSHAFVDFRDTQDQQGVNWFQNSVDATIANRQYAIDMSSTFQTFSATSWGMTASDGPRGYSGYYGSKPSGYTDDAHRNDGTIPPAGALGSVVFTPELVKRAIVNFESIGGLKGKYGYKDAYNFDQPSIWIAKDYIGIDKGITLLMIANYFDETIWEYFMKNPYVLQGLERIGIEKISETA